MAEPIRLPRSTPEEQGIGSASISQFLQRIEEKSIELHSFMLLRHGYVVAEGWWAPYRPSYPHSLFSLSKSFTSTAIGLAAAEGRLTLDAPVISYFPEELPEEVSPHLAAMTIRHLLMMGTGHEKEPELQKSAHWARSFLEAPVVYPPGTHFVYNSAATYMLAAILQKVTGQFLTDYLEPRLFGPLGIAGYTWERSPQDVAVGGWGLYLKTEDIAKFGQLYLQQGRWNGRQLLPEGWVREATSKHIENGDMGPSDWSHGYGYQFWRCQSGCYRGDGAFGQFCIVMEEEDAVVAITSATQDMQAVMNGVWEHLMPAMKADALPADTEAASALRARLDGLRYDPPVTEASSSLEEKLQGALYQMEDNLYGFGVLRFSFTEEALELRLGAADEAPVLRIGRGRWQETFLPSPEPGKDLQRTAASFTWLAADTVQALFRFLDMPMSMTLTAVFQHNELILTCVPSLSFHPKEAESIRGKRMV